MSRYIYQNKLDKSCFQHDMASRDFKDLNRRVFADRVLRDQAFNIAKDPNMLDIKKVFLIKNQQKNYKNQLLECLIKGKYTHLY